MARERHVKNESSNGIVASDDSSGYRTDLGSVSEGGGNDSQSHFPEGEDMGRSMPAGMDDNGRGDGSEYYDTLKSVIKGIREPWGIPEDPARAKYPRAMASLTDRQTPRGKSREVSRISLAATKTGFRATMTDYLISMKLTVDFLFFEDLGRALEEGILGKRGFWTPVKQGEAWSKRKEDEKKKLANSDGLS